MKKTLIYVLVCVFLSCCFYGCKQNVEETKKVTEQNEELGFVEPKEYDTVLTVTINLIFRLYLNADNEVIAIEPVNQDAKSIMHDIDQEPQELDEAIKNIVRCADENNFLKKDVTVDVEIVETTLAQDEQTEILVIVKDLIRDNLENVNSNPSVDIEDSKQNNSDKKDTEQGSENTDKKKQDNKKEETTQNTEPSHKHTYAEATCTIPKKCSCGAEEGKALGHQWEEATCQTPKTCVVCKKEEGEALGHKWEKATCQKPKTCSVCKKTEGSASNHYYVLDQFFGGNYEICAYCDEYKPNVHCPECSWSKFTTGVGVDGITCPNCGYKIV